MIVLTKLFRAENLMQLADQLSIDQTIQPDRILFIERMASTCPQDFGLDSLTGYVVMFWQVS